MSEIGWKIKNCESGEFSLGGDYPNFDEKGKIWTEEHHLSSHLDTVTKNGNIFLYSDCEVLKVSIQYTILSTISSVTEFDKARILKVKEKEQSRKLFKEGQAQAKRRRIWVELNKEFGEE